MTHIGSPQGGEVVNGDRFSTWDAAYVLGSLSSAERREFEAHLETCPRCRSGVAELSGIPALLAMLTPDEVRDLDDADAEPPLRPEVLDSLIDKVNWRRRRARWLTTAAVGVAAAMLAVGVVVAIRPQVIGMQPSVQASQQLEMTKVSPTPFSATLSMNDFAWGTRIDMACSYGDWSSASKDVPPSNLGMVVVGRDGQHTQVATWLGFSGATALPSGNTQLRKDEIASVQLVSVDTGKVLLEKNL
jgi:putative zinc finger protein